MSGQIIYRSGNRYIQEEKMAIVKDYLESNLSRNGIVKKYRIGQGTLIAWLRIFGVEKNKENTKSVMVRKISKTKSDVKKTEAKDNVNQELLKRIEELEKALEYEKLRSLAYSTMIDIAEEDFKIKIRKKDGARQAYSQSVNHTCKLRMSEEIMLEIIMEIRTMIPRIGVRKLHKIINDRLPPELRIGRDAMFDLMYRYDLLIQQRVRRVRTTYSDHWMRKYPNIINGLKPSRPNQIWAADITYVRTENGWVYIHLVTDAYSKMIVGWCVGDSLETKYTVSALKMALKDNKGKLKGLIHHSDRGRQYCSEKYVKLLQDNGILISMCETGDPKENAVAERVNGILKMEWLNNEKYCNIDEVKKRVSEVVYIYNNKRPHLSLNYMTPKYVHENPDACIRPCWRNYYPKASQRVTVAMS